MIEMETELWEIEGKLAPRLNHVRQSFFSFLCKLWAIKPTIVDMAHSYLVLIYFSVIQVTHLISSRLIYKSQMAGCCSYYYTGVFLMGSAFSLHMIGVSDIQDLRIKVHLMLGQSAQQPTVWPGACSQKISQYVPH